MAQDFNLSFPDVSVGSVDFRKFLLVLSHFSALDLKVLHHKMTVLFDGLFLLCTYVAAL